MPELAALGPVFKSSTPVLLTEEGTEYSVSATKHVTDAAVVFQFDCSNTVEEQARFCVACLPLWTCGNKRLMCLSWLRVFSTAAWCSVACRMARYAN